MTATKVSEGPDSMKNLEQYKAILAEAEEAARAAVEANKHRENQFAFDCGFAWAVIEDGRSPLVKAAKLAGRGEPGYGHKNYGAPGWQVWMPGRGNFNGQSVGIFEAGAKAFVEVIKKYGFAAHWSSRLD
jgi:hypothetical protein